MTIYRQYKDISYSKTYIYPSSFSPKRCDLHPDLNNYIFFQNWKGVSHADLALYKKKIHHQDYKRQDKLKNFGTIHYLSLENYFINILKHLKDATATARILPLLSRFVMILADVAHSQWMGEHWIKGSQEMNNFFRSFSRSFEYMRRCLTLSIWEH